MVWRASWDLFWSCVAMILWAYISTTCILWHLVNWSSSQSLAQWGHYNAYCSGLELHSSGYGRETSALTWPYPGFPNILLGIFLGPLDAAVTQKYSQTISVGFCSRHLLCQTRKTTSGSAKLYAFSPINQPFFAKEVSLTFCSLLTWHMWTLGLCFKGPCFNHIYLCR